MSSTGAIGGGAAQHYLCHQCNRTVTITPSASGDLSCPICHGGFVEELDYPTNPNPNPFFSFQPIDPFFPSSPGLPFFFSATAAGGGGPASFDLRNPSDLSGLLGGESSAFRSTPSTGGGGGPEPFNPLLFLQNYIQSLMAGGANIQVVLEGSGGPIMGGNLGDYFIGPGLEQLIQQLAENDPNRYGTPPASKSAIEALPTINITEKMLSADDEAQCAVCKDAFELGAEAMQMPCKHIYHKDCIIPWLELHNSCPVCRYELPTDDPDYEQRARGGSSPVQGSRPTEATSGSSGGGGSEPNSPGTRTVERRFRISLPWPFRTLGSQAEGSNTGDGGNGGSRAGGIDGSSGGNTGGHGSSEQQARQGD